jgi:hypothetical protein
MSKVKEIGFEDILDNLPDIASLNCEKDLSQKEYDVFLCALGFEERCLTIPEKLAATSQFVCRQALFFEYSNNVEDNEVNKPRLLRAFNKFAKTSKSFHCDEEDFTKNLREFFDGGVQSNQKCKIIFDISVCSSKLLLSTMKVLLEFDICLHIVYAEAAIYHPTFEEFEKEPQKWTTEEGLGIARGVAKVVAIPEYPGASRENPPLVIAFPTFKPERTKAIIADIDETLLVKPGKRIIWIVGDPHMEGEIKQKRKNTIRKINKISGQSPSYEVCTLNYKKTLQVLDPIYRDKSLDFHIYISALGSKMQSLGISLFCYVRPDVTVYLAVPKEYNPRQYSEGCKATWQIDFGDLRSVREVLNRVGQLEVPKKMEKVNQSHTDSPKP